MTSYQTEIIKILNCSERKAEEIEVIMREDILHSTLDWLSAEEFKKTVIEADQLDTWYNAVNEKSRRIFNKEYWRLTEVEKRQIELMI